MENASNLLKFISNSPTPYHAIENIKNMLEKAGFSELLENEPWKLKSGQGYYVIRDQSSVIGFKMGLKSDFRAYRIVASHSDTPGFKIKPNGTIDNSNYQKVSSEVYGGPIYHTWLDRPLGIAGRVLVKSNEGVRTELVKKPDVCIIPSLAIHFNREVNRGVELNSQIDMQAIIGNVTKEKDDTTLIEKLLGNNNIITHDIYLYNQEMGKTFGNGDFFASPRIDNLECAYTTLLGFIDAKPTNDVSVYACFNNEEIGSATKQGAGSTFLKDVLERISDVSKKSSEAHKITLANSILVSADNAHAVHPNKAEKTDPVNNALLNGGIVIKHSARQSYTSDAFSSVLFQKACENVSVPYQAFTNRSDERGGGTLGAISSQQVSITSIDIGLAQLAMHSATEVAGVKDVDYMILAIRSFFEMSFQKDNNNWKW